MLSIYRLHLKNHLFLFVVCGDYVLGSVPVRQRSGLPKTSGQLYTSVAKPWHGECEKALFTRNYKTAPSKSLTL